MLAASTPRRRPTIRSLALNLVALILLSSCGFAGGTSSSNLVVVSSAPGLIDGRYRGFATWGDGPAQVLTQGGLSHTSTVAIAMHELWHVATETVGHNPGALCVSHRAAPAMGSPCPVEVEQMRAVTRTYLVRVADEALERAVHDAMRRWNAAVGRTMFAPEPSRP